MNFYDFMDRLDKFTLDHADFDFREMEVLSNKIEGVMLIQIKYGDETEVIVL